MEPAMMQDAVRHILVVDDEPAHAEAISRALNGAGLVDIAVHVAGTLWKFREMVAVRSPAIAIVDLNLPDGSALEVLTSPAEKGDFPVVVMTSYGNEQVAVEAMKAGALDYVVKSSEAFASMPRTVERVLHQWSAIRERVQAAGRERLARETLELLNRGGDGEATIGSIVAAIKNTTAIEAVAIRLQENDDFPYYVSKGFPDKFLLAERFLCARNQAGEILRDGKGNPVLECMCGN